MDTIKHVLQGGKDGSSSDGSSIPEMCKAAVVIDEGTPKASVKIEMVPVPKPGPDEVLLKLSCTGLCMSDLHFMMNDLGMGPMSANNVRSAGHEGAGVVVALGSNVTDWKIGDRAGIKPLWTVCGSCSSCFDGLENYCRLSINTGHAHTGTYQQYLTSPARYTSRIPDGVPDEVAAPIMCSASTMHRALVDAGVRAGEFVVFPGGGGGVGIQGVQLAKAMGFRPIVIDTGIDKKALSWQMGAEAFVDFNRSENVAAEVIQAADGVGAHAVIVTAPQAYKNAADYIGYRVGGRVVCVGLPKIGSPPLEVQPGELIFRKLRIMGSLVGTMRDTEEALQYAKRGQLRQICEVRGMSRFAESIEQLRNGQVPGRIVISFDKE